MLGFFIDLVDGLTAFWNGVLVERARLTATANTATGACHALDEDLVALAREVFERDIETTVLEKMLDSATAVDDERLHRAAVLASRRHIYLHVEPLVRCHNATALLV